MKRSLALAAVLFVASSAIGADEAKRTIQVRGTGTVTVVPDRVSFVAGVETHSASAKSAFAEDNRIVQAVLQALRNHGVADSQLRTANFSINVDYESPQRAKRFYRVTNAVTVTRDKTDDVANLIEAAVDAGANDVNSVVYSVSNPAGLRQTALERAYADARAQAQQLATTAGKAIGEPLEITTEVFAMPQPIAETITVSAAAPSLALESGTRQVSATILVTFELK